MPYILIRKLMASRSRSRSRSPSKGQDFPLMLLIPQIFSDHFSVPDRLQRLRESCQADRLIISKPSNENISELILTIESNHEKKIQSLEQIVNEFLILEDFDFKKNGLTILIPSHIVSVLIGKGGSQIKRFQSESHTEISVIDKIEGMAERQVRIHGKPRDIEIAIENIHRLIRDRVISPEPFKSSSENHGKNKTCLRFIVPQSSVGILIGKNGYFAKHIKSEYNVDIKLLKNEKSNSRDIENIAVFSIQVITGTKESLVDCLPKIIDKICDIQSSREDSLRIIISNSCYRNISYNIKDISSRTKSKIRPVAENDETLLVIEGLQNSKKEAVLMIFRILEDGENVRRRHSVSPRRDNTTTVDVTVPDKMVARLIGRKGEHVKNMIDKSGCSITFHKLFEGCLTPDGEDARLCTLKGNTSAISIAVRIILEQVNKLEHD
jgi:predicted PilT family ATPase